MGRVHSGAGLGASASAARTHRVKKATVGRRKLYSALTTASVAVVDFSAHYDEWRAALLEELRELGPDVVWPAAGGFGAIGAPCMAASPTGYAIDKRFYKKLQCVLADAVEARGGTAAIKTAHLRMAHDRFGIRPSSGTVTYDGKTLLNAVVTAESTHRDVSIVTPDTMTFGGFINLGPRPQTFTCVPGTGLGFRKAEGIKQGFAKMSRDEALAMKMKMKTVIVAPGHAVVFDSTAVHCVPATKLTRPKGAAAESAAAAAAAKTQVEDGNLRKYVSWCMTVSRTPDAPTPDTILKPWANLQAGRPPRIPSGQQQPFFPGNWNLHPARREAFEAQFGGKYKGGRPTEEALKNYPQKWRGVYEVLSKD